MKKNLTLFENIGELITLDGAAAKRGRHIQESDLSIVTKAAMVAVDGRLVWLGPKVKLTPAVLEEWGGGETTVDLGQRPVIPGFVECHTHSVFAGSRAHEFEWRMQGQTYSEISAKGGGILSTVKATRAASDKELLALTQVRADRFVAQGVTTLEMKSGYGLDLETELRSLKIARQIRGPQILTTYLGAHSRSPDFPDLNSYLNFMLETVLPRVASEKLADRVDIYIENGFYDLNQARRYFAKCRELGLAITAHVEQLSAYGGAELALEFEPQSVDHVVYIDEKTMARLSKSKTVAVLLPASDFYLKMRYPPARALIEAGCAVALSTDYNPGTSPTQDLSLVGVLARLEMKMTAPQVLAGLTVGAAMALGRDLSDGSLSLKKNCNFSTLDCGWQDLFYSVGHHPVHDVYRLGEKLNN